MYRDYVKSKNSIKITKKNKTVIIIKMYLLHTEIYIFLCNKCSRECEKIEKIERSTKSEIAVYVYTATLML